MDSAHWSADFYGTQPVSGNYGVIWGLGEYGDVWGTLPLADSGIGNVIVQYAAVPEPAMLSLLTLAFGTLAMRARRVRTAP